MASSGIRDQVAIIGMGCTRFGELWDKGVDDLLTDAATRRGGLGRGAAPRHRRLLARHHDLGRLRRDAVAPAQARLQAGDPGGELLRHRVGGLPQRLLRRGVGRLRHRHGHRGREAQGHRLLGTDRDPGRGRRHRPGTVVARRLLLPGPVLRPQVRRGPRADEGGHEPHRLQEPPERGAQPAGAVPKGGLHGDHRQGAAGGGRPRRLRLQRGERRRRRRPSSAGPRTRTGTATTRCT